MSRKCAGVGEKLAQTRGEKAGRLGDADAALRQEAGDDLGQREALGDRSHRTVIGSAHPPAPTADRLLDAEKG
jgi:hypothetical protein